MTARPTSDQVTGETADERAEQHPFDIVPGPAVHDVLRDRRSVVDIVRQTYMAHGRQATVNPDSYFLRFPDRPADRIIALPARVTTNDHDVAGIKWIASFPGNVAGGLPRASAVLVLNAMSDGYPYACLEAAGISAARTAASATLTLAALQKTHPSTGSVAVFGAGVIARAIIDYLTVVGVPCSEVLVSDPDARSASSLVSYVTSLGRSARVVGAAEALGAATVITATNASTPHLDQAPTEGQVFLNVSLRDFTPESLLGVHNVVDDVDHCLRANTSPHLVEQLVGHRDFVTATIPQLLSDEVVLDDRRGVIVSPFGLGVLDLAVGSWVHQTAIERGLTVRVPEFFGTLNRW